MDEESVELVKYPIYLKIRLEMGVGNVVLSEVDSLVCVVLNRAEKHVLCRELVGTRESTTL
jgi:hypothetical protein